MKRREQKSLVLALTRGVAKNVCRHIEAGHVLPEWDGHELRHLLSDIFSSETTQLMKTDRTRNRAYQTRMVNGPNLFSTAPPRPATPAKKLVQRFERATK